MAGILDILGAIAAPVASAVGAVGNAIGVASNNKTQKELASQQLAANRENQLLAQQFNAAEAQKGREFNEHMYNRSLSDNSPLAQRAALQLAGLGSSSANPQPSQPVQGEVASITPQKSFDLPNTQPLMIGSYLSEGIHAISDALKSSSEARRNEFYMQKEFPRLSENMGIQENYWSSLSATENSLRGLRANLIRAQSDESLAQAAATRIQSDISRALAANQIKVDSAKLANAVKDLAQQAAKISNDYAVGMASIGVQHEDVQNRFKLGAFANYSEWSHWHASLNQERKLFGVNLKEQIREFNRNLDVALQELGLSREEFEKRHGGANVLWDWIGIHPDALLGLATGYAAAKKGSAHRPIGFGVQPKKSFKQKVKERVYKLR